jgi:hypothetical protein
MFQAWNLCGYQQALRACPLKDEEMIEFSNFPTSWKIILEPVTGNIIMLGVHTLYACFTKQGRKTQFYHRMYNTIAEVLHKPRLNVSEYCTQEVEGLFICLLNPVLAL